ncbi:hypothetical protein SH580_15695 [Coraliomargarita algicola]|uniref:Excinuclease ABC subunit C n=1 Tax=Coraliomargarita algicola TaxID=3092156 RepID=A0ABZ0RIG5_9BACT|nr:hypothetical protein [Coraliomargarita sp. J2-16]WPJ94873.1 hypothetical protein SH580_15695 [Coraliomargarita sp. J2-16]
MSEGSKAQLKEKVRRLPHKPGVYQMKDRIGQIIYVGKAKDLKKGSAPTSKPHVR